MLARPPRLLRLQKDERLIALMRSGHERAFETLVERYQSRLLAFCQHMLASREDAEDVLQEVFVAAHKAILADNRALNVRPWLYRIARNRCLNHLRRPVPEGQDTMDVHPHENGASTAERVQNREEFRQLVADVQTLPETQRTALLLREVDALSYEEIAQAMGTTVPSIKSLLVRARITLAESSQARQLTCGEVQLELAEAAEGLRKASGPVRQHVRGCEGCGEFRSQLRSDSRALAALFPAGPLVALHHFFAAKLGSLFGGGSSAGGGIAAGGGGAAGGAATGGAAAGQVAAGAGAALTGAAAGGASGLGGALAGGIGAKAAAGVATAALITAGAVEVKRGSGGDQVNQRVQQTPAAVSHVGKDRKARARRSREKPAQASQDAPAPQPAAASVAEEQPVESAPRPAPQPVAKPTEAPPVPKSSTGSGENETGSSSNPAEEGSGTIEVVPTDPDAAPETVPPEGEYKLVLPPAQ